MNGKDTFYRNQLRCMYNRSGIKATDGLLRYIPLLCILIAEV